MWCPQSKMGSIKIPINISEAVLDRCWSHAQDVPQRTRSLMQTSWPSSLSYTGDGYFIICRQVEVGGGGGGDQQSTLLREKKTKTWKLSCTGSSWVLENLTDLHR